IKQCILDLNDEYKLFFNIKIKKGYGISLNVYSISRPDILASLMLNFPELQRVITEDQYKNKKTLLSCDKEMKSYFEVSSKFISDREIKLQLLAANACYFRYCKCKQELNETKRIRGFFINKHLLYQKLSENKQNVTNLIQTALKRYSSTEPGYSVVELMYKHILRSALFPAVVHTFLKRDLYELAKKEPFAFDFGKELSIKLTAIFPRLFVGPEYLVLYALMAFKERNTKSNYKVILISEHQSLGAINKLLLEKNLPGINCNLESHFKDIHVSKKDTIILLNSDLINFPEDSIPDYSFSGLLNEKQIYHIKEIVRDKKFQDIFVKEIDEHHVIYVKKDFKGNYFDVLKKCLGKLVFEGAITPDEETRLIQREKAGNQLIVDHFAIPHIVAETAIKSYRIFSIFIEKPVIVEKQKVSNILIVLVSEPQADKSNIFGYLYKKITGKKGSSPASREELLRMFH
ncbi:PTS sugar transporter subunit IIA, partial [Liquorilactobacillus satsumensis]